MDKSDWAWLAGLYEGEGSLALTNKHSMSLRILMTDEDIIRRCLSLTGLGHVLGPYTKARYTPIWSWSVERQDEVQLVVTSILPWLGERRRARVLVGLERMKGIRKPGFCKRGHQLGGTNDLIQGRSRTCRTCKRWNHARIERRNRLWAVLQKERAGMDQQGLEEAQNKMAMAESVRQQLMSETDPEEIARLESDYELLFDEGRQAVLAAMEAP